MDGIISNARNLMNQTLNAVNEVRGSIEPKRKAESAERPTAASKPASTKAPAEIKLNIDTKLVSWYLQASKRQFTVDDDGDARADYRQSKDIPFDWFIWYYPKGDCLMFDSGEKGNLHKADLSHVATQLNAINNGISMATNSNGYPRLKAKLNAADYKDLETFCKAWYNLEIFMAMAWCTLAKGAETTDSPKLNITTEFMKQALDLMHLRYTVDNDGDIRVDYNSSAKIPFSWFIWYYPKGNALHIDSGQNGKLRTADISKAVSEINSWSYGLTIKSDSNDRPRIKATIDLSEFGTYESFGKEWDRIMNNLPLIWSALAAASGLYDEKPEPPRTTAKSSSSTSRASSSGSSSSATDREEARREKEVEKRRKNEEREAARREKERKDNVKKYEIKRREDSIKQLESLLRQAQDNVEICRRNKDKLNLKGCQDMVKYRRSEIARLKKEIQEIRAKK